MEEVVTASLKLAVSLAAVSILLGIVGGALYAWGKELSSTSRAVTAAGLFSGPYAACDMRLDKKALAALIEVASGGQWVAEEPATRSQVELYLNGVRGVELADATLLAASLAISLGREIAQIEGATWPKSAAAGEVPSGEKSASWSASYTLLLEAVRSIRDECEASSRLIPPMLDRDGGQRAVFRTVSEQLDVIIATHGGFQPKGDNDEGRSSD